MNPAPARELSDSLLQSIDVLTPNETEFEQLSGHSIEHINEEELAGLLLAWERKHGHRVCLTRGKAGCSFVQDGKLVTLPAPAVDVVDTTGAGDAFNAALSYGLCCGWTFEQPAYRSKMGGLA